MVFLFQFVLFVGDSHLRALADGFVRIPESKVTFGFLSVPGADALGIRTEVLNVKVPRVPDAVCVLAPSNNLDSTTVYKAAVDFAKLIKSCGEYLSKVKLSFIYCSF